MGFYDSCVKAKKGGMVLASLGDSQRDDILEAFAAQLVKGAAKILSANAIDMENAKGNIPDTMLDRLFLDNGRIDDIASAVRDVKNLEDPLGIVLDERVLQSGLRLLKTTVPLGVVGIIYEARPNVTADSIALCVKSGNACVLKVGSEAILSSMEIAKCFDEAINSLGYDVCFVYLLEDTSREASTAMMRAKGFIDVLIPRGGAGLIQAVVDNATIPVLETGAGNCHLFIDSSAKFDMALEIAINAKTQRPSVCNAIETMLVHTDIAIEFLPLLYEAFDGYGVEIRGCERSLEILGGNKITTASEEDFYTEYNDMICALKIVGGVEEAIEHVNNYSTSHSEAIVTEDTANAELFLSNVDSAVVYHNASTRFTDGGVFGLGAEIGISTQKLHARGPMALRELTSYKYKVYGQGQVR
ncbi:MAG: glutamate-5-semialdehyde dehydrogenase [Eubacteriaceae bacterium]|nr:glutamate-5-semialdehyde dehydrogenase [Eubacteriaceae bacterium]